MLIKQGQNNLFFIFLLISLLITLSSSLTFAQNPSTQIELDFSKIQGVSAGKETFTLEVKDSKVDISHIVERIRSLMSQSDYLNSSFMSCFAFNTNAVENQIESLCSKFSTNGI